ncbi:AzlD domain-containing protein [uncultured Catenibacterium sp.]|uniref:branched-chain amino acid transporter permease n=1 Tax=uncultured Catenibacterium sp. TaxID=286142 RepID=UPI00345448B4
MHAILIILTAAIVTLLIRALPFIVFSKHTPDSILYLGKVLPYAIIPMLVVYCLKSVSVLKAPYGIPELIALIVVVCIRELPRLNTPYLKSRLLGCLRFRLRRLIFKSPPIARQSLFL